MLKAILVGLKQVDPNAYGGWNGTNGCAGCEKDVDALTRIVESIGYSVTTLKTAQATRSAIIGALESAANQLKSGDTLVFFFSGHGGQQPDVAGGDESDGRDETLVAYDGELVDDQLNGAWLKFKAGVRIFMLSDSCNSGTNYRGLRSIRFDDATPIRPLSARATVMQAQLHGATLSRWGNRQHERKEG